jgi:hypothetical protein
MSSIELLQKHHIYAERQKKIEFLVSRKHPSFINYSGPILLQAPERSHRQDYERELLLKSNTDIDKLYDKEIKNSHEEIKFKQEKEEEKRIWNQAAAKANKEIFEHYCTFSAWNLHESVVLALGRNPKIVTLDILDEYPNTSPFAKEYLMLSEFLIRSGLFYKQNTSVDPMRVIEWLKKHNKNIPAELQKTWNNLKQKTNIIDWQNKYETIHLELQEHKNLLNQKDNECKRLKQDKAHLQRYANEADALFAGVVKGHFKEDSSFAGKVISHLHKHIEGAKTSRKTVINHYKKGCLKLHTLFEAEINNEANN